MLNLSEFILTYSWSLDGIRWRFLTVHPTVPGPDGTFVGPDAPSDATAKVQGMPKLKFLKMYFSTPPQYAHCTVSTVSTNDPSASLGPTFEYFCIYFSLVVSHALGA